MHGSIPHTLTIPALFSDWLSLCDLRDRLATPPEGDSSDPEDIEMPLLAAALALSLRRCLLRKMMAQRPQDAREAAMVLWAYTNGGTTPPPPPGADFWRDLGGLLEVEDHV